MFLVIGMGGNGGGGGGRSGGAVGQYFSESVVDVFGGDGGTDGGGGQDTFALGQGKCHHVPGDPPLKRIHGIDQRFIDGVAKMIGQVKRGMAEIIGFTLEHGHDVVVVGLQTGYLQQLSVRDFVFSLVWQVGDYKTPTGLFGNQCCI
jgi:hypothetical protein